MSAPLQHSPGATTFPNAPAAGPGGVQLTAGLPAKSRSSGPTAIPIERINLLGEMVGGIAHDFRNLLAVIGSALNLAQRHVGDAGRICDYLAAARESVERGSRLASRLLALGKPRPPDLVRDDLTELIRETAPFLRYGAGARVECRFELIDELPLCLVDRAQFSAALLNLVVNARDAMPGGGTVTIRTGIVAGRVSGAMTRSPRCVRVEVGDCGSGMSPDVLRSIFDPWFTTKGETGTGLGLPQVAAFMRMVGGCVNVTSRPGRGTSFELLFPVDDGRDDDADLCGQVDRWMNEGGATPDAGCRRWSPSA